MGKMLKNKKKKGFTLIEMVAVVAIIGILAAILVPKVTKYMEDAKKTKVVGQARMVNLAIETAIAKSEDFTGITNIGGLGTVDTVIDYMEFADATAYADAFSADDGQLNKLDVNITLKQCKEIADGKDFKINSAGKWTGMGTVSP